MSSEGLSRSSLLNILNIEYTAPSSSDVIAVPAAASLKRSISPMADEDEVHKKRKMESLNIDKAQVEKEDVDAFNGEESIQIDGNALVEDLAQELQCGCCSELVYRPVIVNPCQHFFCGSCCTLWIKNGGTNCPACRGVSTIATPSRALQSMVDVLLRAVPQRIRAERERQQADAVYAAGRSLKIPTPREPSPEPNLNQSSDYVRPCPHCSASNAYGWRCPQPVADPSTDTENAWPIEDGAPPGHAYCGNCESLLSLLAPSTSKCDMCQVSFCGINVQGRCCALPLMSQHPHAMSDIGDLIQSADVYECFDSNTVEVEIMLDYMTARRISPRHVYREIVQHIQNTPRGFASLIEQDLFVDMHAVGGGIDPDPNAPRTRICRMCATEVLLWGLRDWWVRERQKGQLEASVTSRKDCPDGRTCRKQSELIHAKEFNHIIAPPVLQPAAGASNAAEPAELQPTSGTVLPRIAELGIPLPELPYPHGDPTSSRIFVNASQAVDLMALMSASASEEPNEHENDHDHEQSQVAVEDQLPLVDTSFGDDMPEDFFVPPSAEDEDVKEDDRRMAPGQRYEGVLMAQEVQEAMARYVDASVQESFQSANMASSAFRATFVDAAVGPSQDSTPGDLNGRLSVAASTAHSIPF